MKHRNKGDRPLKFHHLYAGSGHIAEAVKETVSEIIPRVNQSVGLDTPVLDCEDTVCAEHVLFKGDYILAHSTPKIFLRKAEHVVLDKAVGVLTSRFM